MARKDKKRTASEEEKLRKKREAERRRYNKLKETAAGREKLKNKEIQQYLKKKEKQIIRPINELSNRQKRAKRKQWKINSKNYRANKKLIREQNELLSQNTPPMSDDDDINVTAEANALSGKRRAARNRKARSREIKKKDDIIKKLTQKIEKYKKRCQRLKNERPIREATPNTPATPHTRVNVMLEGDERNKDVVKRLVFNEVLCDQLKENYRNLKSDKEKQVFKRVVTGNIVKKYRVQHKLKNIFKHATTSSPTVTESHNLLQYIRKTKHHTSTIRKRNAIWKFLESDLHSKMCPGKKDYVMKKKVIKQKRYLTDTLRNLHKKFLRRHPDLQVSYEFWCRNRPYWIVSRKVTARDTCACTTCTNMQLVIQSLFRYGVFKDNTCREIVKNYCCEKQSKLCLLRECRLCNGKNYPYNSDYDASLQGYYFKWVNTKDTYFDNKTQKQKTVKKTIKNKISTSIAEMIKEFQDNIKKYLPHRGRQLHQLQHIDSLKSKLNDNELLIHMDFSENYCLKYSEEIQSFHFGGSRQQISLHTVVLYSKADDKLKAECFCTLSESLKHDVPAIWAHLRPILNYIKESYNANTLHFLSDSPSTQYRNKSMFYFLGVNLKTLYPQIQNFTWNYSEAGHGKGAPDGVGGVTKRTADRIVGQGKDVASLESLVSCLKENVPGVRYFIISTKDIEDMSLIIEKDELQVFPGTMKVHQVVNNIVTGRLDFRMLSSSTKYYLGSLNYNREEDTASLSESDSILSECEREHSEVVGYTDVYSDSDNESGPSKNLPESKTELTPDNLKIKTHHNSEGAGPSRVPQKNKTDLTPANLTIGTYVVVALKTKKTCYRYVAVIQSELDEDGEMKVMYLRAFELKDNFQIFRVDEKDVSYISFEQIIFILPTPSLIQLRNKIYYKFPKDIDVFEQN